MTNFPGVITGSTGAFPERQKLLGCFQPHLNHLDTVTFHDINLVLLPNFSNDHPTALAMKALTVALLVGMLILTTHALELHRPLHNEWLTVSAAWQSLAYCISTAMQAA